MNFIVLLVIVGAIALPIATLCHDWSGGDIPPALRFLTALAMIPVMMFCTFGYLASSEPMANFDAWVFRLVYAVLGLGALFVAAKCLRRRDGAGSALPTFRRRLLAARTLYFGIALFAFGVGPLLGVMLLSSVEALSDPDPNPVGLGLLAIVSFYPSLALVAAAVLDAGFPYRDDRKLEENA